MKRRDIEGLRALAVGVVVLYHAHFFALRGGFVGVDVFFVLSGFLITSLLASEFAANKRISLRQFYARRARRLLPASTLVIVATVIAGRIWLEPLRLRDLGQDAIASAGFFANITFANRGTDYLQSTLPPSALQHFWSLAVEEQFYVVWPALLALLLWRSRSFRTRAVVGISVLSIASFAVCIWQTNTTQQWAFFGLHARAWELGLGALLALAWNNVNNIAAWLRAIVGWLGLVAVIASCFLFNEKVLFPGYAVLLPVVGTLCVLIAGDDNRYGPQILLRFEALQFIGARSYSLYLWHWPALIIGEAAYGHTLNATERILLLGIAFCGACLSYAYVENPVRHSTKLQLKPLLALTMGGGLIAVSLAAGIVLKSNSSSLASDIVAEAPVAIQTTTTQVSAVTTVAPPVETTTTIPLPPPVVVSPAAPLEAVEQGVLAQEVPSNLDPSLRAAMGDKPIIYDNGCHVSVGPSTPKKCEYGAKKSPFTVALFGDSHAAQWFPTIQMTARQQGWRFLPFTKSGCPPIDLITWNMLSSNTYPQCRPWRKNVIEMMIAEKVQVVFISSSVKLMAVNTRNPFLPEQVVEGQTELLTQLKAAGITPILITDTPYPGDNLPICLSRNIKNVPKCTYDREKGYRAERIQAIIDAGAKNEVQVLDISNWLCGATKCPAIVGNILVNRDGDHITTKYAQFLQPLFDAAVSPYVNYVRQRTSVS